MFALPFVRNSYHDAVVQEFMNSGTLTLYRQKMRKDLTSMNSSRVVWLSQEQFHSGLFVSKLPLNGAAVFVIDDPFHSTCRSASINSSLLDDPRILAIGAENWLGIDHAKVTVLPIG